MNKLCLKRVFVIVCLMAAAGVAFFALRYSSPKIPVLNYHMIDDEADSRLAVGTKEFAEQMKYLSEHGYTSITPDQLLEYMHNNAPLPSKPILITFDDGYKNNYQNAYPIMQKYGFTGTIFLITDYIGNNDWYLNWEEVREMQQHGFVFGSHTLSHTPITDIPLVEAEKQLRVSREVLEWRLGVPVTYFAYPTGAYSPSMEAMAKSTGYDAAFTVDFGKVTADDDAYALKRIPIFKSKASLVNFYLRLELTPVANTLRNIKERFWPAPPEEEGL